MRVITGSARGRKLKTLDGLDVRPTTDRVKEAMFSTIQFDINGAKVLDLFSGSGQMGIEALSRGADSCVFVDKSKASLDITRENIAEIGFISQSQVTNMDSVDFLQHTKHKFDIAILDPPYNMGLIEKALSSIDLCLNDGAKVLCEHEKGLNLENNIGQLKLKKKYKYGKVEVSLFIFGEEKEEE